MSNNPLVSVVIPAFNAAATIDETVGSVLGQTISDLEVIVVDDGSADDTQGTVRAMADSRVRLETQANAGAAAARNTGINAARGRYVAFLDSDDLWLETKLERQLAVFDADPRVRAVQTGAFFVDDDLEVIDSRPCRPWEDDRLLDVLLFKNLPAFGSSSMFVRACLMEVGGWDDSLVILEDWNLAIDAARHCNLESIADPLVLYRQHPGNRSQDLGIHIEPGYKVLGRLFSDPSLPAHIRESRARDLRPLLHHARRGRLSKSPMASVFPVDTVGSRAEPPKRRLHARPPNASRAAPRLGA